MGADWGMETIPVMGRKAVVALAIAALVCGHAFAQEDLVDAIESEFVEPLDDDLELVQSWVPNTTFPNMTNWTTIANDTDYQPLDYSTGVTCENTLDDATCEEYVNAGDCYTKYSTMKAQCALSCDMCFDDGSVVDTTPAQQTTTYVPGQQYGHTLSVAPVMKTQQTVHYVHVTRQVPEYH